LKYTSGGTIFGRIPQPTCEPTLDVVVAIETLLEYQ
jgi:hypothetical protein